MKIPHDPIAEEFWLNYYNDYLFSKGFLSESERNKIKHIIDRPEN